VGEVGKKGGNGTNGINEERGDSEFREFKEFKEIRERCVNRVDGWVIGLIGSIRRGYHFPYLPYYSP
jgi:hypothetical protein